MQCAQNVLLLRRRDKDGGGFFKGRSSCTKERISQKGIRVSFTKIEKIAHAMSGLLGVDSNQTQQNMINCNCYSPRINRQHCILNWDFKAFDCC